MPPIKIIALLTLIVSPIAEAELRLESYHSGVFQRANVELESGERLIGQGGEQIHETANVPAKLGSKFGIRYRVSGKKDSGNRVTYLYLTPGVKEPDGTRHDKYEEIIELKANVDSHVAAFEFTEDYEVVSGTWELLIFSGDSLLVRSQFIVSANNEVTEEGLTEENLTEESLTPRITPVQFND